MHISKDIVVVIDELSSHEFEISGQFLDVVPLSENTPAEKATNLQEKVNSAISSRLTIFCRLLSLVAHQGSFANWVELDVAITAFATLLEQGGLSGAIDCLNVESSQKG